MEFDATGVYPANITARAPDGSVDQTQTAALVDFLYSKGVDGLHVCGSTGEFATLKVDQRKAVAEACIKAANGRGRTIVHVGAVSTEDSRALARHAARSGAYAVSSVPPYYYCATPESVLNHYRSIAAASGLPVVIYDNPHTTGFTITVELAKTLAEEGTAHGIKLARHDMYSLAREANLNDGSFVVYPVETFYLAGLATAPRAGTIGSMGNWIPEAFVGIKRNFEAGNLTRAAELQRLVCELISAYGGEEVACTKALVEHRGVPCGDTWEPLLPLTSRQREQLYENIDAFDLDYEGLAAV